MEACTLSLSTVESETELVTGKMEEMKVAPEHQYPALSNLEKLCYAVRGLLLVDSL